MVSSVKNQSESICKECGGIITKNKDYESACSKCGLVIEEAGRFSDGVMFFKESGSGKLITPLPLSSSGTQIGNKKGTENMDRFI
jgi:hypothetical protein